MPCMFFDAAGINMWTLVVINYYTSKSFIILFVTSTYFAFSTFLRLFFVLQDGGRAGFFTSVLDLLSLKDNRSI